MKDYGKVITIKQSEEDDILSIRVDEAAQDGFVVDKIVRTDEYIFIYFVEA